MILMMHNIEPDLLDIHRHGHQTLKSTVDMLSKNANHDLAKVFALKYSLKPAIIFTKQTKHPIHSFVFLEGMTVDAFGINNLAVTLKRFNSLAQRKYSEACFIELEDLTFLMEYQLKTDADTILKEYEVILNHIGLDLSVFEQKKN